MYSQVYADIDSGASMTMTPHASLISEAQQCNMSIKMADGPVLTSNIKRGFLDATCNGKLLQKIEALHVPNLAATLISSPQLVSEGHMDMVHPKRYGSFMQPACDSCPICTPHADKIMIETTATDMSISIMPCDTRAFFGKSEQVLELTSTTRTVTSEHSLELIELWHARLGGLSFKRLQALAKLHPSVLKIPLQASSNEICYCCQRSSMKRGAAPPSISREVSPLEEVNFDIFTFNGRYNVYLIDQGSRAEFTYSLDKKSDLLKDLQRFLIECNTAASPVGSFVHQLPSQEDKGINAAALDSYFKDNGIRQQVKIIYGDNAGKNDGDSLNLFLTRLGIRHLSSIAKCQFQNGLAENGVWVLGCGVCHDMDLSGLGPMFEEFSISLNAQRRNFLPHESLSGRSPFSILFPTKTPPLHLFKPFGCRGGSPKKDTTEGPHWHLYRNHFASRPIWLSHLDTILKKVSQQHCTPCSTIFFSRLAVSHHESTIFLLHCHQLKTNCSRIIYLSHITLRHMSIQRSLL